MDSSSIVKFYVEEVYSQEIRTLKGQADGLASCVIAYVEVRAALAAARRARRLRTEPAYLRSKASFEEDWHEFYKLEARSDLLSVAGNLAEAHALSGFDALHLAVALALQAQVSELVQLSTWDRALSRAAEAEGLALAHEVST